MIFVERRQYTVGAFPDRGRRPVKGRTHRTYLSLVELLLDRAEGVVVGRAGVDGPAIEETSVGSPFGTQLGSLVSEQPASKRARCRKRHGSRGTSPGVPRVYPETFVGFPSVVVGIHRIHRHNSSLSEARRSGNRYYISESRA